MRMAFIRQQWLLAIYLVLALFTRLSLQQQYVQGTDAAGNTVFLSDSRQPALYTRNFGDCQGDSMINVTRFDAAYYHDNMTVLFHLEGSTIIHNASLMSEFDVPRRSVLGLEC
jgi:hypothetical protein